MTNYTTRCLLKFNHTSLLLRRLNFFVCKSEKLLAMDSNSRKLLETKNHKLRSLFSV